MAMSNTGSLKGELRDAWTSCLDTLDFNIYCCRHDFTSKDLPVRVQRLIRGLSLVSLIIAFTELCIGGYVSNFFSLPVGVVHLGAWWVSLTWLASSVCGVVCLNRGWVMATLILSALGIPIGIGGAASDARGYHLYTDSPPMGCAQISVTLPVPASGGRPQHRNLRDMLATTSTSTSFSLVDFAGSRVLQAVAALSPTTRPSMKPVMLPRISAYGPSQTTRSLAHSCLSTALLHGSDLVSTTSCYCTVPSADGSPTPQSTDPTKNVNLECQILKLTAFGPEGGCTAIFDAFLPSLKASYGLTAFLIVLNALIFAVCCTVLCTVVYKNQPSSSSSSSSSPSSTSASNQSSETDTDTDHIPSRERRSTYAAFMASSPVKFIMSNPLFTTNGGAAATADGTAATDTQGDPHSHSHSHSHSSSHSHSGNRTSNAGSAGAGGSKAAASGAVSSLHLQSLKAPDITAMGGGSGSGGGSRLSAGGALASGSSRLSASAFEAPPQPVRGAEAASYYTYSGPGSGSGSGSGATAEGESPSTSISSSSDAAPAASP